MSSLQRIGPGDTQSGHSRILSNDSRRKEYREHYGDCSGKSRVDRISLSLTVRSFALLLAPSLSFNSGPALDQSSEEELIRHKLMPKIGFAGRENFLIENYG